MKLSMGNLGSIAAGLFLLLISVSTFAQTPASGSAVPNLAAPNLVVPNLVNFSGTLTDLNRKPLSSVTGVTFLLYKDEQGGAPLWMETQNVQPDKTGHYTVILGSTTNEGLPQDVFVNGEARWLGVQIVGQEEQPRVLLVAVPYALKAGDAETVGGLPASAFALANGTKGSTNNTSASTPSPTASTKTSPQANRTVTGKGTVNFVPLWDKTSDIVNSLIFQKSGNVGINTTAPAATLDVNGQSNVRDTLTLFPKGTDPTLAISGTPFKVDQTGHVTFAAGQTFPGAGTITGVTTAAGSGLTGGGTTGTLSLSLAQTCTSKQVLQWNGTSWVCASISGSGTVTSVGLSAPSTDFTVSGSPVTSSGTLGLNWTVAPTADHTPNAIVKRDSTGSFNATNISLTSAVTTFGLVVNGNALFGGRASFGGDASFGNVTATGVITSGGLVVPGNASLGNVTTTDTTATGTLGVNGNAVFGGIVGIGTNFPQVELNLDQGDNANNDALLIGNYNKGLQLRDTGSAVDLESWGVPLYVNNVTQQPTLLNPSGGVVYVGPGATSFIGAPSALVVGTIDDNGSLQSATFLNDVEVLGNFDVLGSKNFRIDHPLDPTNKYLYHAAIESSEVLNQYSGNVVLDGKGEGRVEFPAWFAAINEDFRYQLTAIGAPGPNLYIAEEIKDASFTIAGGKPGMKVSWQVTARRNDAYMRAHPYAVERDKPEGERGYYTDPELYGAPKEQGIRWAHPASAKDAAPAPVKPPYPRLPAVPMSQLTGHPEVHN